MDQHGDELLGQTKLPFSSDGVVLPWVKGVARCWASGPDRATVFCSSQAMTPWYRVWIKHCSYECLWQSRLCFLYFSVDEITMICMKDTASCRFFIWRANVRDHLAATALDVTRPNMKVWSSCYFMYMLLYTGFLWTVVWSGNVKMNIQNLWRHSSYNSIKALPTLALIQALTNPPFRFTFQMGQGRSLNIP